LEALGRGSRSTFPPPLLSRLFLLRHKFVHVQASRSYKWLLTAFFFLLLCNLPCPTSPWILTAS
jgi:hypothetical protein